MITKLTLSMDDALINRIKAYADKQQTTISELTQKFYLQLLPNEPAKLKNQTLGPISQQLVDLAPALRGESGDRSSALHEHWDTTYGG